MREYRSLRDAIHCHAFMIVRAVKMALGGGGGYNRKRSVREHTHTHKQTALPLRKWIWIGTSVCLLFVSGRLRIW